MGMRARLERDLDGWKFFSEKFPKDRYAKRRIHLLEFVLSGRDAELSREARLHRHLRVAHGFNAVRPSGRFTRLLRVHDADGEHLDVEHEEFR